LPDHGDQVGGGKFRGGLSPVENPCDEIPFGVVQLEDFLLDGTLRDDAIDDDRFGLSDAVRPVGGLIFHGRIPPRVHVDDVIGGGQIQSGTARFERDEECGSVSILECIDFASPLVGGGRAVEVLIGDFFFVEHLPNELQVLDELAEDQDAMPFVFQFDEGVAEQIEFCGSIAPGCIDQFRVAGQLLPPLLRPVRILRKSYDVFLKDDKYHPCHRLAIIP
jgi:hypothetical protein